MILLTTVGKQLNIEELYDTKILLLIDWNAFAG